MLFKEIDGKALRILEGIVGKNRMIWGDKELLEPYGKDESGIQGSYIPDVVVKPSTKEEVSEILSFASKERIPVTPRGAGSGLSGGSVPLYGGIVISSEAMNRVLDVDRKNLVCVSEPGVVTNELCRRVMEEDLYYAGYPMSVETSFIGGNVATNAGGGKVIKYGSTFSHVLGLEVVVPDGVVLQFGGKRRKDSSGYAIHRLFVGSEGTLGFFTKVYLNLIPKPGVAVDLVVPFENSEDACNAACEVAWRAGELPSSLEFMDSFSVDISSEFCRTKIPYADRAGAYLILQFEAKKREHLDGVLSRTLDILSRFSAMEVLVADTERSRDDVWKVRRNWLEALKAIDRNVVVGDVVVPPSEIPRLVDFIRGLERKRGVAIPTVGHIGDGNLHPAPLKPEGLSLDEWLPVRDRILEEIAEAAHGLGGAISGEHGVGFLKSKTLSRLKKEEIKLMWDIKKAIDPKGIMNPGKIFLHHF